MFGNSRCEIPIRCATCPPLRLLWPTHTVLRLSGYLISKYRDSCCNNLDLRLTKPRYMISRVNPMTPMVRINDFALLSFKPFGNAYSISLAPCYDLMLMGYRQFSSENINRPFLLCNPKMTKCSSTKLVHLLAHLRCLLPTLSCNFLVLSFHEFEGLSLLSFSHDLKSFRETLLHALIAENLQPRLSVEVLRLCFRL
jgi:hypothetical protein